MAAIVDPRALAFVAADLRPMAEKLRIVKVKIDDIALRWASTLQPLFPDDASVVEDGRSASILSGADVNSMMTILLLLQTAMNVAGRAAIVAKPCVRALEVS